ncbi:uncharacterized protein FIESC28_09868 [Fusarium coffeatum]|uniref:Uncharacterized protein n=1 Tax=Fusarium coffeatum TaxID=231269 RepID=A0A366QYV3_9HYPO|nr:uncharacterized protein FIESC28_09868 [Fusarium coffeatum]RBR09418.1 hypothetical protein FIESC28_09868 [Fusarium coffeatum]
MTQLAVALEGTRDDERVVVRQAVAPQAASPTPATSVFPLPSSFPLFFLSSPLSNRDQALPFPTILLALAPGYEHQRIGYPLLIFLGTTESAAQKDEPNIQCDGRDMVCLGGVPAVVMTVDVGVGGDVAVAVAMASHFLDARPRRPFVRPSGGFGGQRPRPLVTAARPTPTPVGGGGDTNLTGGDDNTNPAGDGGDDTNLVGGDIAGS